MKEKKLHKNVVSSIIFDLDGTLVDSFSGIAESLRHAISMVDPTLDISQLKSHIGPPLHLMLSQIWPQQSEEVRNQVLFEFRSDYNSRGCLYSIAYPGIPEALNLFHSLRIRLFVLTNKPETPTRRILAYLGLQHYFSDIHCPDSITPHLKTKSEGALILSKNHRLIPTETLLVGDSQDDLRAAQSIGFTFLEASYGYGKLDEIVTKRPWLQLKSPSDLSKIFA